MAEHRHQRGLLDTSVLVAPAISLYQLPEEGAVSTITFAELAAGPLATNDLDERARRQERLQRVETTFDPLPFDLAAARAYGRVYAAVAAMGRKARGRRAIDLLIAAAALSVGPPLYTCTPTDFEGLDRLIEVVAVDQDGVG